MSMISRLKIAVLSLLTLSTLALAAPAGANLLDSAKSAVSATAGIAKHVAYTAKSLVNAAIFGVDSFPKGGRPGTT